MNKIDVLFSDNKKKNIKTNIAYIVAGYPNIDFTKSFLLNLDKTSVDLLEIGIPYSDPLADGSLISEASFKASEEGITTDSVFNLLMDIKDSITKPLVFLVYYNLIFSYGIENFIEKCIQSNIQGLIIPDLPYEESEDIFRKLSDKNISLIPLVSVTSENRIERIISRGSGFIYAIGSLGVTGSQHVDLNRLESFIENIEKKSDLPVALGFGIKNNDDVNTMRKYVDGVIVGTSIVSLTSSNDLETVIGEINNIFRQKKLNKYK